MPGEISTRPMIRAKASSSVIRNRKKIQVSVQRMSHHKNTHLPLESRIPLVLLPVSGIGMNPFGLNQCTPVLKSPQPSLGHFTSWHNVDIIEYHEGQFS